MLSRWMFKLSEWTHFSSYDVGLNSGSSASHIVVFSYSFTYLLDGFSVVNYWVMLLGDYYVFEKTDSSFSAHLDPVLSQLIPF